VVFRVWPKKEGGGVIALFPTLGESYEHMGGHGSYDPGIVNRTKAAKPEEYASLRRELEGGPYNYKAAGAQAHQSQDEVMIMKKRRAVRRRGHARVPKLSWSKAYSSPGLEMYRAARSEPSEAYMITHGSRTDRYNLSLYISTARRQLGSFATLGDAKSAAQAHNEARTRTAHLK
jgi:hypothetical protein